MIVPSPEQKREVRFSRKLTSVTPLPPARMSVPTLASIREYPCGWRTPSTCRIGSVICARMPSCVRVRLAFWNPGSSYTVETGLPTAHACSEARWSAPGVSDAVSAATHTAAAS